MIEKVNIVNIYNEHKYNMENFAYLAKNILDTVVIKLKQNSPCCIAIIFSDETTSYELNKNYRHKDYIPDVLSFANNNDNFPQLATLTNDLGDVYICYPKALRQAKTYGHSLMRELSFLFLHGLLHNLGYDHENEVEEKVMFTLQDEILNELNITRK